MDDLAAAFSGAVGVSFSADSSATQHPRMCLYKTHDSKQSQGDRRRYVLNNQKERRKDYSNIARQLAEDDWANISLSDDDADGMDQSSPATKEKKKKKKKERYYSNQLMLSEWLVDVPEDLSENWLMVPCPVGKRAFIMASRGKTHHYTKSGYCLNRFQSGLPGGSARQSKNTSNYTILDGVYSEVHRTFWVLDIMCWHGHPVYDSDTEFRFFWLQSKLSENPELAVATTKNSIKFMPLPSYPCDRQVLQDAMAKPMPFPDELDGLLFYHKAVHYVPGVTPLIGWLKPWMLPEILSVPIPQSLIDKKPPGAQLRPPSASTGKSRKSDSKKTVSMEAEASPAVASAAPASTPSQVTGKDSPSTNPVSMPAEAASVVTGAEKGDSSLHGTTHEPSSSMEADT